MTESKHLKARIRARMARTGERYQTARRHVVGERGAAPPTTTAGGCAAASTPTARRSRTCSPTTAPTSPRRWCSGAGGGLGAGYILWEFEAHGSAHARARLPQPVAVPGPLGGEGARAPRRAVRAARDRRREGRGGEARRGARGRAAGDRHRRPPGDRLLAHARAPVRPRRLPGRRLRGRRRPRADRRPQPRAADGRRASGSTPRAPASAPTSTGSW